MIKIIESLRRHWPAALLSIIFLALSLWNLGSRSVPKSNWKPPEGRADIYLELERETYLESLFIFVQDDHQVNIEVFSGSPDSWIKAGELKVSGAWKQWQRVFLNSNTRYVGLVFTDTTASLGEIVLFSKEKPAPIRKITALSGGAGQEALIDEPSVLTSLPSFKEQSYFDEVYFARAAEEYLTGRVPFEWSHPPLGKLIISYGVFLSGSNPFAWRISGVVISAITIILVYLLGLRLLGRRGAWIAAFLITFDFMHFTESRLATGETFIFFFVVLMFLLFLRYYREPEHNAGFLFLSLAVFGFGFATKWITFNSLIGLLILLAISRGRKAFSRSELTALVLGSLTAALIYFISYVPDLIVGRKLKELWPLQFSMLGYHSNLKEGHPFGSPWWGWPVMYRPMWLYSGQLDGQMSEIVLLGNPVLWWASIPALLYTGWLAVRHGDKLASFIVIPYLSQWLLFSPISRILFLYHFYPNLIFLVLATTFSVQRLWTRHKYLCVAYLGVEAAAFVFFFPLISGLPAPSAYWEWVKNWVLLPR